MLPRPISLDDLDAFADLQPVMRTFRGPDLIPTVPVDALVGTENGHRVIVIPWAPTIHEAAAIAAGATIWLWCYGTLPVHALTVEGAR